MNLILVGYGKMGKAIHELAQKQGCNVIATIDSRGIVDEKILRNAICIDFSNAAAFEKNYKLIADNCSAAVVGTTGWQDSRREICDYFLRQGKTLIYADNFSIGANIHFAIVDYASKLLAKSMAYDPYLLELHHREKKDRPSGTAKALMELLGGIFKKEIFPASLRSGWIRGVHEVGYESVVDKITIRHEAYARDGFATGALWAAEWSGNTPGVWNFRDLLLKKMMI